MIINVREIPEEGLTLRGSLDRDIFELREDTVKPDGPVTWDLYVSIVSESILAQGVVGASFQLNCVRCLEFFPLNVEVQDFIFSEPLEGRSTIDLTEAIREDILLALPIYPRCEDGTPPRTCPMAGEFEEKEENSEEDDTSGSRDIWSGLEGLKSPPPSEESN